MGRARDYVEGDIDPRIGMFDDLGHDPVFSFEEVLQVLDEKSPNNAVKGNVFELLVMSFLRTNPEHKSMFETVMRWSEWREKPSPRDIGIDLIARRRKDKELVAIQCKFKGTAYPVQYGEIASFLVAASLSGITRLMLVATTNRTDDARLALRKWPDLMDGVSCIDIATTELFSRSEVDWSQFNLAAPVNMVLKGDRQLDMFDTVSESGRLRV